MSLTVIEGTKIARTSRDVDSTSNSRQSTFMTEMGNDSHARELTQVPVHGFRSVAKLESNAEAFDMALLFANGLIPFAALLGTSGWGKTQLLDAAASSMRANSGIKEINVHSAMSWVSRRPTLPNTPLILDDVQDVLKRNKSRLQFQIAIERRIKAGRPTLLSFTSDTESPAIRAAMPSRRDWIVSVVRPPSSKDLEKMVFHLADNEGLVLSQPLIRVLAHWLQGDGRTISGALKRLKLQGTSWSDAQGALRACGVINPFLAANPKWDLRDATLDAAKEHDSSFGEGIDMDSLALFTMLRIARLCESEVALYMGLEPGKAYQRAMAVEEWLSGRQDGAAITQRFAESIVNSLLAV